VTVIRVNFGESVERAEGSSVRLRGINNRIICDPINDGFRINFSEPGLPVVTEVRRDLFVRKGFLMELKQVLTDVYERSSQVDRYWEENDYFKDRDKPDVPDTSENFYGSNGIVNIERLKIAYEGEWMFVIRSVQGKIAEFMAYDAAVVEVIGALSSGRYHDPMCINLCHQS